MAVAVQWAQKPSSTHSVLLEIPREWLLSGRIGQEKERGGGGGKNGGKAREGWKGESIERIPQIQWYISNYDSARQIPTCSLIVLSETSEAMRGPLYLAECLRPSCSPLSMSSVLCILGRTLQYNCFLPIFLSAFTRGLAHNSIRLCFTPYTHSAKCVRLQAPVGARCQLPLCPLI